jgi:MFS family permease
MDLSPVRESRDFRVFYQGQLVSTLGNQLTVVAIPYQTYLLTHSSLFVGLVSIAQLIPLITAALIGGAAVDAVDRRKLVLVMETLMLACSAGLALNSDLGPSLWPIFLCSALQAGFSGVDNAARNAMVPRLVGIDKVTSATALFQATFQLGTVVGPTVAGLLLAGAGVRFVYWLDVASFVASLAAIALIGPQPPARAGVRAANRRSVIEGFKYLRGKQDVQGAYVIDLNAMVFGMPRALFPALGTALGGPAIVGLLYTAPGVGALLGAVTTGWVGRVRRQGLTVIVCVLVWGAAITGFGLVHWLVAALILLAVAGWADVISAVFRNTIIQQTVPDEFRGRLMGVQIAVVTGGPRLGDLESGAVASAFGNEVSVVSGGLACVVGGLAIARILPGFTKRVRAVPTLTQEADYADVTNRPRLCGKLAIHQPHHMPILYIESRVLVNSTVAL